MALNEIQFSPPSPLSGSLEGCQRKHEGQPIPALVLQGVPRVLHVDPGDLYVPSARTGRLLHPLGGDPIPHMVRSNHLISRNEGALIVHPYAKVRILKVSYPCHGDPPEDFSSFAWQLCC